MNESSARQPVNQSVSRLVGQSVAHLIDVASEGVHLDARVGGARTYCHNTNVVLTMFHLYRIKISLQEYTKCV